MIHDPLCALSKAECRASQDARHSIVTDTAWCDACQDDCHCDLIAKVRADERECCIAEVKALGPLQQFQEGYFIWGRKTVDVDRILRSQP